MESGRGVFDRSLCALSTRGGFDKSQCVVSVYKARGVKPLEVGERQKIDVVNAHLSCCESNVDGCVGSVWYSVLWSCPTPAGMLWHVTVTPLPHVFHSSLSRRCLSK